MEFLRFSIISLFILWINLIDLSLSFFVNVSERDFTLLFSNFIKSLSSFARMFLFFLKFLFKFQINFLVLMNVRSWSLFLIAGREYLAALYFLFFFITFISKSVLPSIAAMSNAFSNRLIFLNFFRTFLLFLFPLSLLLSGVPL